MRFKRIVGREAHKKALLKEKEAHRIKGEKWDPIKGWIPAPLPVRKYINRKVDRHTKVA